MELKLIKTVEYPDLHILMLQNDFPNTPYEYSEALEGLNAVDVPLGLYQDGVLVGAVLFFFGPSQEWEVDIVMCEDVQKIWATKPILEKLYKVAFEHINTELLFAYTERDNVRDMLLRLGFIRVEDADEPSRLVLTKDNYILRRSR